VTYESVVSLQFHKKALSSSIDNLIGLNSSYYQSKGANAAPRYLLKSLSEYEKQVYMCPASISVITDSRVLEVQEIRPIDILAMLLTAMTDNKNVFSLVDVLEEFLDHHTFVEACAMLLQIVLEENGSYLYSKSISDGFRDRPKS
jgi:hypothetical protein